MKTCRSDSGEHNKCTYCYGCNKYKSGKQTQIQTHICTNTQIRRKRWWSQSNCEMPTSCNNKKMNFLDKEKWKNSFQFPRINRKERLKMNTHHTRYFLLLCFFRRFQMKKKKIHTNHLSYTKQYYCCSRLLSRPKQHSLLYYLLYFSLSLSRSL